MTELEQRVCLEAERLQQELFDALSCLVQQNTENFNDHGNEQNIVMCVSELYQRLGLKADVFSPLSLPGFSEHEAYLPGNNLENRPNVCAAWPGTEGRKSVMIAGHSDTVQIGDESKWTVPPLSGLIKDGKIWGRGTVDDKQGIAAGWFVVRVLQSCGVRLKNNIVLTAYSDEEAGGGHGALAAVLKYPSDIYLNLDGFNSTLFTHGTGGGLFEIEFKLRHPPDTAEPVYLAVQAFLAALSVFWQRRRDELDAHPIFKGSSAAAQAYRLNRVLIGGTGGTDMRSAAVNFMFYSLMPRETLEAELRQIIDQVRSVVDQWDVDIGQIKNTTRYFLPVTPDRPMPAVDLFNQCIEAVSGKKAPIEGMCLSDLPMFYYHGKGEVFNYGVGGNFADPGGAHQVDENIDCAEFLDMCKSILLFLLRYES